MYKHIFIFSAFVALADSHRFRRTLTISTSIYGTSPIVSVTSIPSLSAVASQSASPSDSKTTRPSSSSLPSIRPSITQTPKTTRPSSSSLPSIRPSITQTPSARACDDYYKNSDDDDVEIPENCRPNKYAIALLIVIIFTISLAIFVHKGLSPYAYNNLNYMQKIIFIIVIISSISYYVYLCVLLIFALLKYNDETIKYNDETQTIINTCVLAGLWILSVSCTLLVRILTPPPIVLSSDPAPESLNNGSGGSSNDTLNINECSLETGERKDLDLCPICQDNADLPRTTLSCRHSFHTKCINKWYKSCSSGGKIPTCPDCRAVMHTLVGGAGRGGATVIK